ncbi:unnamed protein product, partial [Mesorhabditis spiculigera]
MRKLGRESVDTGTPAKKAKTFDFRLHPRRKVVFAFCYLGWHHDGLVQQENSTNTVEHHLMNALLKTKLIESWEGCGFTRCGRTDKGVSAFRQIAACIVRSADPFGQGVSWADDVPIDVREAFKSRDELQYLKMLNGCLPPTIRMLSWAPARTEFDARHSCTRRTYKYSMPKANLDVEKMRVACSKLVGTHDFRNYCQIDLNADRLNQSYVREIFAVSLCELGDSGLLELTVEGSGFLWHMIRFIVSVLHEVGCGHEGPEVVSDLLDIEKCPARPQYTMASDAPLCLFECQYERDQLAWQYDESVRQRNLGSLQRQWAELMTKARTIENMMNSVANEPGPITDAIRERGLLEFTQAHPWQTNYLPLLKRKRCDTLEVKRAKLEQKSKVTEPPLLMSARRLKAVGYPKINFDYDDDSELAALICHLDEQFLKKRPEDWHVAFMDEKNKEAFERKLAEYLSEYGISTSDDEQPAVSRRFICDFLLSHSIDHLYDKTVEAQEFSSDIVRNKRLAKNAASETSQNPYNTINCAEQYYKSRIESMAKLFGIAEHPDPEVTLRACCLFVQQTCSTKNRERIGKKEGNEDNQLLDIKAFPLGITDLKDPVLDHVARCLRLLSVESLRSTQTIVNETLIAIQNLTAAKKSA